MKITRLMLERKMALLRAVTKTPVDYMTDGKCNIGHLYLSYSAIYGGWSIEEVVSEGGAITLGPLGLPTNRVPAAEMFDLIHCVCWHLDHKANAGSSLGTRLALTRAKRV